VQPPTRGRSPSSVPFVERTGARVTVILAALDRPPVDPVLLAERCSPAERERAGRYRSRDVAARWLAGRGILRTVLGVQLGVDPAALRFTDTSTGKPALTIGGGLHFNLSHSGPVLAVAFGPRPVGVDIEVARRVRRPERLADRLFGPDSPAREGWARRSEPARTDVLLQAWTRAEALLKATGEGVGGGLAGAVDRMTGEGWVVRDLACPEGPNGAIGPVGAVAAAGSDWLLDGPRWLAPS